MYAILYLPTAEYIEHTFNGSRSDAKLFNESKEQLELLLQSNETGVFPFPLCSLKHEYLHNNTEADFVLIKDSGFLGGYPKHLFSVVEVVDKCIK